MFTYWNKQTDTPLFPEILWSRPVQKVTSGKLLIVGGSVHQFNNVALSYQQASIHGAGEVRAILPDALKRYIGASIDCVYTPSTATGTFSKDSLSTILGSASWADAALLIGDIGRNSETTALLTHFLQSYATKPIVISRDALDALKNDTACLYSEHITLVASFSQLQELAKAEGFSRALTSSMGLVQFVEFLHDYSLSFPYSIITLYENNYVVASGGAISTTPAPPELQQWRTGVATRAAVFTMQNPLTIFKALTSALVQQK